MAAYLRKLCNLNTICHTCFLHRQLVYNCLTRYVFAVKWFLYPQEELM